MPNLLEKNSGYLQQLQNLNLYSPNHIYDLKNSALVDIISTTLTLAEGVDSGFANSLAARVLEPNTPIQQIGNIQLAKALALRAAGNLRNLLLPVLNIQGTNISFLQANYWHISNSSEDTSISGLLKTILSYTPDENPIPFITKEFTAKDSDNYLKGNRGKGQIDTYLDNISQNEFSPDDETTQYGGEQISQTDLILGRYDKSLLSITNSIISNNSLKNGYPSGMEKSGDSISQDALAYIDKTVVDTSLPGYGVGASQLVARGDGTFTDDSETKFLRTFNYQKPYQGTKDLMKFNHGNAGVNSVLQTVYPNIAPLRGDANVKNLMFSIENLAYSGQGNVNLKDYEKGANGGRAMWFPPYDITLNETISANWQSVEFIGRSEPIYTFNNRERSINLGFMLIVDYPSALNNNEWKKNSDNDYNKFFRQDNELKKKYTVGQIDQLKVKRLQQSVLPKTPPSNVNTSEFRQDNAPTVHYDNNRYSTVQHLNQDNAQGKGQKDNDDFFTRLGKLIAFVNTDDGKKYKICIGGFASKLATSKYNKVLSFFRAKDVYDMIISQMTDKTQALAPYNYTSVSKEVLPTTNQYVNDRFEISIYGSDRAVNQNSTKNTFNEDVIDRKVMVWLDYNPALDKSILATVEDPQSKATRVNQENNQETQVSSSKITGGEYKWFERLKNGEDKQLTLQTYAQKIDFFHPAFHSQTPEDFNTRLTFLQQCTLQGKAFGGVSNSIFGKPPVCVLRLGDFFHTKMIITNVQFSYEPLLWDVNPEGIGMQPMLCYVSMECKILGGQDLSAPLTRLQNALSYNFYANTSVYHTEAKNSATENTTNTNSNSTSGNTNNNTKVNSQLANVNAITVNPALVNTGDINTNDGKTGTISYNEKFDDLLQILTSWSNSLLTLKVDTNFSPYLNTSTGLLNLNDYNLYFNALSESDKAAQAQNLGMITQYASLLAGFSGQYNSLHDTLVKISLTNKDGNKILNTTDGTLNIFDTMLNYIEDFYATVIKNITANSSDTVKIKLTALVKYNDKSVQSIPFTT